MSDNKLYIAAAGAGKTTFLVKHAYELFKKDRARAIAIISFTQKNQQEIKRKLIQTIGYIPNQIKVCGWFDFLLNYCIRPFMGAVIEELRCKNVGIMLVNGISGTYKTPNGDYRKNYKTGDDKKKFLTDNNNIYSDKLSEFAVKCYKKRMDNFKKRLVCIFSSVLIDEIQDLSAWDFDIISILLKIDRLHIIMCGDLRQQTYLTNNGAKWAKYRGRIDRFLQSEVNKRRDYVTIDYETLNCSHRFGKEIASFASYVIGNDFRKTEACQCEECMRRLTKFEGARGVFLLKRDDISIFILKYNPLVLIWDKSFNENVSSNTHTYGDSKGMTADTCLIFPTQRILSDLLSSKENKLKDKTRCKLYVAVTRARYISAIVVDNDFDNSKINLPFWRSNDMLRISHDRLKLSTNG